MDVVDPYVSADTPLFASVRVMDEVPDPLASPDIVIVDSPGKAAHVGADVPLDIKTCPAAPASDIASPDPVLYTIPPLMAVNDALVPPFASDIFVPLQVPEETVPKLND